MRIQLLLIITIIITLASCRQKETKKTDNSGQKPTIELNDKVQKKDDKISIPEQYIENDSLLTILETDLENLALNSIFSLKAEPIINAHDETIMDTLKTLTYNKTNIYLYQAANWESIYKAKIENSEFKFLDSVAVGMTRKNIEIFINHHISQVTKEEHEEGVKVTLKADVIKVGNLEQTSVFTFNFVNDTLKSVDYQGYVD